MTDVQRDLLQQRADALGAAAFAADLRQAENTQALIDFSLQQYGRLDGLANCAGVWVEGPSELAREDDWHHCVDINLKAVFFLCSRAIPALRETQGAIVNVSSDAGVIGNAGAAIYCASKGGVTVMSKALARELAPSGIRVNALCPSDIFSHAGVSGGAYGEGDPEGYYRRLMAHYPQQDKARFLTLRGGRSCALAAVSRLCRGDRGQCHAGFRFDCRVLIRTLFLLEAGFVFIRPPLAHQSNSSASSDGRR
jgi:NAD(P)-dependent dehydrogenase (short-subunit alcohol dehydrogenase family)